MEFDMNRFPVAFLANLILAQGGPQLYSSSTIIQENALCFECGRLLFTRPFGSGSGNSLHRRFDLKDPSPLLYIRHAPIYWLVHIMLSFRFPERSNIDAKKVPMSNRANNQTLQEPWFQ